MPYDQNGCWSGSAIMHHGKMYLMYTGNSKGIQQQCLAYSEDGVHFEKYGGNPVIRSEDLPKGIDPYAFRDPYVIRKDNGFVVFVGAKDLENDCGCVLVYKSENLFDWEYVGKLISRKDMVHPGIFECTSYAEFGEKCALIASLNFMPTSGKIHRNFADTIGLVGNANLSVPSFYAETETLLDYGFDYYAPQILHTKDGRKILIGLMQMWEVTYPTQKYGWVGSLAAPRELTLCDNHLRIHPVRELKECCCQVDQGALTGSSDRKEIHLEGICRIRMKLQDGTGFAGFQIVGSEGGLRCCYYSETKEIIMRRWGEFVPQSQTPLEDDVWERIYPCNALGEIWLDAWIDISSVEVFINYGEAVMTSTYFLPDKKIEILESESAIEYFVYSIETEDTN